MEWFAESSRNGLEGSLASKLKTQLRGSQADVVSVPAPAVHPERLASRAPVAYEPPLNTGYEPGAMSP